MNTFHDAFLDVRRRIEEGEDPDAIVPELMKLAAAQDEIDMAESLYDDDDTEADDE